MKFRFFVPLIFAFVFSFSSCGLGFYQVLFNADDVEKRVGALESLSASEQPNIDDDKYSFLLITDVHVGTEDFDENYKKFLKYFSAQMQTQNKLLNPRFVVTLGDNMNTGVEYQEYNSFLSEIKNIALKNGVKDYKIYSTIGNHDLYHNGWENFKKNIYPYKSAYTFTDGVFNFYMLDSANGTLGENQRNLLFNLMKKDKNPKIVLMHVPLYAGGDPKIAFAFQDTMERNKILSVFEKNNVKQVYEGHAHQEFGYDYGSWKEEVTPALKNGFCRLVTVDKINQKVTSEIIEF